MEITTGQKTKLNRSQPQNIESIQLTYDHGKKKHDIINF